MTDFPQKIISLISFRFTRTRTVLCLLGVLIIWFLRRPDQLLNPYVWAEESFILRNFLDGGVVGATFTPVQGQLLFLTGLIEGLILSIAPRALPELEYLAATLLMLGTVALLLYPSSLFPLRLRMLFGFGLVLVPVNPETFGVWLYSFWWIALWPLIILFWQPTRLRLSVPLLLLSSISSLAAGALFPLFVVRWFLSKDKSHLLQSAALATGLGAQVAILLASARSQSEELMPLETIRQLVEYPGEYLFAWLPEATQGFSLFIGALIFLLLLWSSIRLLMDRSRDYSLTLLALALVIFALLSALPEPVIAKPNGAGPRYFFLPFIVITWIFIYWFWHFLPPMRTIAAICLGLGVLTLAIGFSRSHEPISLGAELNRACATDGPQTGNLRIHLDGALASVWNLKLTREDCERLME